MIETLDAGDEHRSNDGLRLDGRCRGGLPLSGWVRVDFIRERLISLFRLMRRVNRIGGRMAR